MAIKIQFDLGHSSKLKNKKTSEGFTHDWELYVQGVQKADISQFVEKVVFNLHGSFRKPKRTFKEPPYILKESGYAGFSLPIDIYFKNRERVQYTYELDLQQTGPPTHRSEIKKYIFDNPAEEFRQKLLKGGGVPVTASGNVGNSAVVGDDSGDRAHLLSKPKLSIDAIPTKKPKVRTDDSKANTFANLFGTPITKNAPKISPDLKKDSAAVSKVSSSKDKAIPPAGHTVSGNSKESSSSSSGKGKEKSEKTEKKDKEKGKHINRSPHKDKQRERDEKKEKKHDKREKHHAKDSERNREEKSVKRVPSPKRYSPVRSSSVASREELAKDVVEKKPSSSSSHSSKKSKKEKKSHEKEKERDRREKEKTESKKREEAPAPAPQPPQQVVVPTKIREKEAAAPRPVAKEPVEPKLPVEATNTPNLDTKKTSNEKDKDKDDKRHKHKKKDKEKKSKDKSSKHDAPKKQPEPEQVPQKQIIAESMETDSTADTAIENPSHNSDSSNISLLEQPAIPASQTREAPIVPVVKSPVVAEPPAIQPIKPDKLDAKKSQKGETKKRRRESTVFVEPPSKASKKEKSPLPRPLPVTTTPLNTDEDKFGPTPPQALNREYLSELQELHQKIMTLQDNNELQQVVELIVAIGKYEITSKTFDFDLCKLDRGTVQRLQDILATSVS